MMRHHQHGFSLVAAIFLLVILSAMGVFMIQINTTQQTSTAWSVLGSRAYLAARSGIEYAAYQALNGNCSNQTLNFSEGVLAGFQADLTCSVDTFSEAGNTVSVYSLQAQASSGNYGETYFVSRTVQARFSD